MSVCLFWAFRVAALLVPWEEARPKFEWFWALRVFGVDEVMEGCLGARREKDPIFSMKWTISPRPILPEPFWSNYLNSCSNSPSS